MTFYQKVLQEYEENIENSGRPYLCNNSRTFKHVWVTPRTILMKEKIMGHAYAFLCGKLETNFAVNSIYIFSALDTDTEQERTVRIDFLKWCIENNLDI